MFSELLNSSVKCLNPSFRLFDSSNVLAVDFPVSFFAIISLIITRIEFTCKRPSRAVVKSFSVANISSSSATALGILETRSSLMRLERICYSYITSLFYSKVSRRKVQVKFESKIPKVVDVRNKKVKFEL